MRVLHITPHMGGGVGAVLLSWLEKVKGHSVHSIDYINDQAKIKLLDMGVFWSPQGMYPFWNTTRPDIVVVHYWDHAMLYDFLKQKLPPSRLVFWCHKNFEVPQEHLEFPDIFLDVSPVQGHGRHIWSVRNMTEYLNIKPQPHPGFNVGYVGTIDYKKLHSNFLKMCNSIKIPDIKFIMVGEINIPEPKNSRLFFTGKLPSHVTTHLSYMDVFGYPLRPDHFGTCEQVLGEAMAAGVVPVCMNNPAERYIIDNEIDGILCDTEEEYATAIQDLYKYSALRGWMSNNARKKAKHLYSIDRMVREWNDLFEEIMEQPKKEREPL